MSQYQTSPIFCTHCGSSVGSPARFCTACGKSIPSSADVAEQSYAYPLPTGLQPVSTHHSKPGSTILFITGGFVVLALVLATALLLGNRAPSGVANRPLITESQVGTDWVQSETDEFRDYYRQEIAAALTSETVSCETLEIGDKFISSSSRQTSTTIQALRSGPCTGLSSGEQQANWLNGHILALMQARINERYEGSDYIPPTLLYSPITFGYPNIAVLFVTSREEGEYLIVTSFDKSGTFTTISVARGFSFDDPRAIVEELHIKTS